MEELYQIIEDKIKEAGYLGIVNGLEIYSELSDLIEGKENGTYILMSKKDSNLVFEYQVDIMSDNFNLSYIRITEDNQSYHANFDD